MRRLVGRHMGGNVLSRLMRSMRTNTRRETRALRAFVCIALFVGQKAFERNLRIVSKSWRLTLPESYCCPGAAAAGLTRQAPQPPPQAVPLLQIIAASCSAPCRKYCLRPTRLVVMLANPRRFKTGREMQFVQRKINVPQAAGDKRDRAFVKVAPQRNTRGTTTTVFYGYSP